MGQPTADFQIANSPVRGVKKGSEGSLVIVNETLYYHSRNGVCAYDGSLPVSVSAPLGSITLENARAALWGTVIIFPHGSRTGQRCCWSMTRAAACGTGRMTWQCGGLPG